MRNIFFRVLLFVLSISSYALNAQLLNNNLLMTNGAFYVSVAGTGDGSQANPWGPSQLTSNLATIQAGSTVYLNKGDVFYNLQINLTSSINFDAYGTGANPIIAGSSDIGAQTWTLDASNVYYTTMGSTPKWLFVNGTEAKLAETAFIPITARAVTTTVTASSTTLNALNATESLVGAIIVAKEWDFRPTYRNTVSSYSSGVITMPTSLETDVGGAPVGSSFKLMNHKSFISAVGDWMYDAGTSRLYVKTSGSSPAGTDIKACFQDYGINISSGVNGVSIKNIDFKHQYLGGIYAVSNSSLTINGCSFHDIIIEGLSVRGDSYNTTITNNTLYNIGNNAIHIGGVMNGNVSYNTIHDIGTQARMSFAYYANTFRSVGCGIHQRWDPFATIYTGDNVLMEYNTIHDVGYCGIVVVGTNHTARYNVIYNFCQYWNDGAGVYISGVYGQSYGHGSDTSTITVNNNVIRDALGSASTIAGFTGRPLLVEGAYADNECHVITVTSNSISNMADSGVKINYDVQSGTVTNNLIVGSVNSGIQFNKKTVVAGLTTTNYPLADKMVCTGNSVVSKSNVTVCISILNFDNGSVATDYNPFANGGSCNNNVYVSMWREKLASSVYGSNGNTSTLYTLSEWQGFVYSTNDASSTNPFIRYYNYVSSVDSDAKALVTFNETTSTTNPSLSGSFLWKDVAASGFITSLTILAISGQVAIQVFADDGTLTFNDQFTGAAGNITGHTPDLGSAWTVDSGTNSLDGSGNLISTVAGEIYQTLTGNTAVTIETVGQVSTNNTSFSSLLRFTNSTTRIQVQVVIDASVSANNKVVVLSSGSTISTFLIGAVQVLNNNYRLKVRINAGRVIVWFTDATKTYNTNIIDVTSGTISANNPTGVKHGLRIPTTAKYDYCKIYAP